MLPQNSIMSMIASVKASELALKVKQNKLDNASMYVKLLKELNDELLKNKTDEQDVIAFSPMANNSDFIITSLTAQNPDFIIAEGLADGNISFILSSIHQFQICFSIVPKDNKNNQIGFHS
ncbi:MAG: hypothetical protein FD143_3162 [Ignavibacteria bacterium]|nr:MAG: hypothetical protein FD143_3162 [Ignavibacteria bacterium]KAF0154137.1 MAG: hypothetical protein FD188_3291 [Ignavibacteria bacterium]